MTGASTRVFERKGMWSMNPVDFRSACQHLAEAALARYERIDTVIGIARGGCPPAFALAARTGASKVVVEARHNHDDSTYALASGTVEVDPSPLRSLAAKSGPFLIVDDICGTGLTLRAVTAHLRAIAADGASIATATLCRNAGAPRGLPNLYVWDVADWVIFPWEASPPGCRPSPLPPPSRVSTG